LKEKYYRLSREKGITFIRFDEKEPPIVTDKDGALNVILSNSSIDKLSFDADLLVLSAGIVAPPGNANLAPILKIPLNEDQFFLEAHMKLRPVDFATEGIYLCGLAHAPKSIKESIAQASAAVSRASTILSKETIEAEGNISYVDPEKCIGCGSCVEVCPYNAISLTTSTQVLEEFTVEVTKSEINPALCKGCGKCVPRCPVRAITQKHFTNEQITLMEDWLLS
jgi:heterodisulfide reductase subunit A